MRSTKQQCWPSPHIQKNLLMLTRDSVTLRIRHTVPKAMRETEQGLRLFRSADFGNGKDVRLWRTDRQTDTANGDHLKSNRWQGTLRTFPFTLPHQMGSLPTPVFKQNNEKKYILPSLGNTRRLRSLSTFKHFPYITTGITLFWSPSWTFCNIQDH